MKSLQIVLLLLLPAHLSAQFYKVPCNTTFDSRIYPSIDALDSSTAVIAGALGVIITNDGGQTSTSVALQTEGTVLDVEIEDRSIFASTSTGEIWSSNDLGETWTLAFKDTSITKRIPYIRMFDAQHGIARAERTENNPYMTILYTQDGKTWKKRSTTFTSPYISMDFGNMATGYLTDTYTNHYKTIDSGKTFTPIDFPINPYYLKFYNHDVGVIVNYGGSFMVTPDGGNNYTPSMMPRPYDFYIQDLDFYPGKPSVMWLTDGHKCWNTPDSGKTWEHQSLNPPIELFVSDWSDIVVAREAAWVMIGTSLYRAVIKDSPTGTKSLLSKENITIRYQEDEDQIIITWNETVKNVSELTLSDMMGRTVYNNNNLANSSVSKLVIDTKHLTPGMHVCTITGGDTGIQEKIVVLR